MLHKLCSKMFRSELEMMKKQTQINQFKTTYQQTNESLLWGHSVSHFDDVADDDA